MSARGGHAPDVPTRLTVDDDAQPLAVTDDPAFGWLPHDADRGEIQTAYEIVVYDAERRRRPRRGRHARGRVGSAVVRARPRPARQAATRPLVLVEGAHLGPEPASRARTPRSRASTAASSDADWKASWIRRPGAETAPVEDYSFIRKTVAVGASPIDAGARVRVGRASVRLRDQRRAPRARTVVRVSRRAVLRDDRHHRRREGGRAATRSRSRRGGDSPARDGRASVPALIAQISIEHADGSREVVTTDGTWRTHTAGRIQDVPRNDEGDFVEHVDERRIPPAGTVPAFDDAVVGRGRGARAGRHQAVHAPDRGAHAHRRATREARLACTASARRGSPTSVRSSRRRRS